MDFSFDGAILENIQETFHEPDGILPYPYLDPGGVYSKSLWDWDSYWTFKGLIGIAEKLNDDDLKKQALKYGTGAVNNFFHHQGDDGALPILMNDTDADCFDCLQSKDKNMAKPVFGQFCDLIAGGVRPVSNTEEVRPVFEMEDWCVALKKFYDCYEMRYLNTETGLYVWANDVAIGVDDDPSTWGRPPFSSANIFLNCFLYADLKAAANFARGGGIRPVSNFDLDSERAGEGGQGCSALLACEWDAKAAKLADAINEFCWDERDGMYYSFDVLCQQNLAEHRVFGQLNVNLKPFWKGLPIKVMSWVSFLPLWCGIATKERAERMINDSLVNEKRFWAEWGVRSLSADERMYSPSESRGNPSNWLGPVWIISNYLIWEGVRNYDRGDVADGISAKIQRLLNEDYSKNQLLHENYNPETGEGIAAPGFWNWNILAFVMR